MRAPYLWVIEGWVDQGGEYAGWTPSQIVGFTRKEIREEKKSFFVNSRTDPPDVTRIRVVKYIRWDTPVKVMYKCNIQYPHRLIPDRPGRGHE